MIPVNELRIGNLIYGKDSKGSQVVLSVYGVAKVEREDIIWYDIEGGFYISTSEAEPIPITEEWLLNQGFNKIPDGPFNKDGIHVYLEGLVPQPFSKFVHQLQNTYFILTGEELILKD